MTSQRFERRAGWAGIVFVAVFAAGGVLGAIVGGSGDTRAEVVAAYSDSGDNAMLELSTLLMALALVPFVPFLVGLCSRVSGREEEERGLALVALVGGVLMAGFLALTNLLTVAVPAAQELLDDYAVDAGVAQTLEVASWWGLSFTSIAGTLLVGAASLGARRSRAMPRWLTIAGVGVAFLGLFGLLTWGLSIAVEILWMLAASIAMIRRAVEPATDLRPALAS
jgi:hypothetical protein